MNLKISAAIATRGDVNLRRILKEIAKHKEIDEVNVETSQTPYGWYVACQRAKNPVVYYQDDDCVTDLGPVIAAFEPDKIVNAMTKEHAKCYPGNQTLIGFGAVFEKRLLSVLDGWERDPVFLRESVRVFATLIPHKTVFPKIEILPCAYDDNRLYRQVEEHAAAREEINRRIWDFMTRSANAL
jgi:hypothetical protein